MQCFMQRNILLKQKQFGIRRAEPEDIMEKLLERFGVQSEAELKKKIERAEPLNIGIFVTGGKEDEMLALRQETKAV